MGLDGRARPGRDVLPGPLPQGEPAGVVDGVVAADARIAEQGRQDVEAVRRGPLGERLAGQRREAGQQVDLVHQRVGDAGPDPAGPADQERHPRAPLEQAVLAPAQRPGRPVAVEVAHRPVGVAVVHHRAVVAGEHDERAVRELEPVERVEDLADAPVQLLHDVAAHAAPAGPREPRVRARAARGCRGWRSRGRTARPRAAR